MEEVFKSASGRKERGHRDCMWEVTEGKRGVRVWGKRGVRVSHGPPGKEQA